MKRASGAPAVLLVGAGWLLVAVVLGVAGVVRFLQPPAPPIVLFGLTTVLLGLAWGHAGFREWLRMLDARWLVAPHLTRYVGITSWSFTGRAGCRTRSPCRAAGATSWRRPRQ